MKTCLVKKYVPLKTENGTLPSISSIQRVGGAGIVLYVPDGSDVSLSLKLKFLCSNNEAAEETLLIGLISTLHMGIRRLSMQ